MAFYLVLSLGATAGLFFLAGADFVGAMQLMIYVGGTLVLLVFGVMLTAQAPLVSIRTSPADKVLGGLVAASLLAVLLQSAFSVEAWRRPAVGDVGTPSATPLGMALLGVRVDADPTTETTALPAGQRPVSATQAAALNPSTRSGYLLPFEIVSVHLLVVLVGAAYLARAKRRRTPRSTETAGLDAGGGP
ncbi:MAG: NADH-quinone oxidoreductase subunit J [Planctomycetota bacterium]|nr:MAG: NADH-quinone oxidoreductase subunit J [Planctomycetota bacterium]